jgi:hypothetical protein
MKLHSLYLTSALVATTIPLSALAAPTVADHQAVSGEQAVSAKKSCPAGWIWEPAGYMGNGHWRPAHCARRNTYPF